MQSASCDVQCTVNLPCSLQAGPLVVNGTVRGVYFTSLGLPALLHDCLEDKLDVYINTAAPELRGFIERLKGVGAPVPASGR